MTFEVIRIEIKYLRIHNISVQINFYQNRFINESFRKKFVNSRKETDPLWPLMTFEVILIEKKYLRIHNISVHIIFYQNRFINESVRKNFLKFS